MVLTLLISHLTLISRFLLIAVAPITSGHHGKAKSKIFIKPFGLQKATRGSRDCSFFEEIKLSLHCGILMTQNVKQVDCIARVDT